MPGSLSWPTASSHSARRSNRPRSKSCAYATTRQSCGGTSVSGRYSRCPSSRSLTTKCCCWKSSRRTAPGIRRWKYLQGNCWMRNSCKETSDRARCGSFYLATGMFQTRAAILRNHFARRYSNIAPHVAALKGCSFPDNQTLRYGLKTVPECLSCSLQELNIHPH